MKTKIKVEQPIKNVFLVTCNNSVTLAKMFLRFQEYYESTKFRGKVFTFKTFKKWYSKGGKFTYYSDWGGFNIPGYVVDFFRTGAFSPLTPLEKKLLDMIPMFPKGERYYVIGSPPDSIDTKTHELAHAMFYLHPSYNLLIRRCLRRYTKENWVQIRKVKEYLLNIRYDKSVLIDELHAWIMTERETLKGKKLWNEDFDQYYRELNLIFKACKGLLQEPR